MPAPIPCPLTLITGFLGSGKTTLIKEMLAHETFANTMVIVNEFGEIGIDHSLMRASTEEVILLPSGCLCCTLRGDLRDLLRDLVARRLAAEIGFDRVVLETTGLADPAPILHTLLTDPVLAEHYRMDGVVTVVDAVTGAANLRRSTAAQRQVALADLVVLSKTDLPEAQPQARSPRPQIARLNPAAEIVPVVQGRLPPDRLRHLGHFDAAMSGSMSGVSARAWIATRVPAADPEHLSRIRTVSWEVEAPLTASRFDLWMDVLMARRGADVLRFKGIVHLQDMAYPFAVHGVQHIFHPPLPLTGWQAPDRHSRFVMIVQDFSDDEVAALCDALAIVPLTEHLLTTGYLGESTA
ncbi:GTP-binding protein (plasmid) [Thioclava litoralis]|uniref:GTP-binding protein n=1 Tax=Thioclava litoralis TaxID=3076557 RepID=A0ABZ1E7W2_9RHOB|nr:GTP-binding protein [Thioclava sp. FTW29]